MKKIYMFSAYVIMSFFLFQSSTIFAQTNTPRYVKVTSKVNGYYEYLPQGYNPSGTTTYPLVLFFTGIGEFGNGDSTSLPAVQKNGVPKLIANGTFPTSFTVNGQTFKFIVITPQFIKNPLPKAIDIDSVLTYMIAHYKVDKSRIYITGLSYGGGLTWAYVGANSFFAKKVTAIVPVASATAVDSIYSRSRVIAGANLPVWATHNQGDSSAPLVDIQEYIDDINLAPAPYPKAKITIFPTTGHDAWTRTYDPNFRENGLSVYEWMLQFQLGVPHPPPVNDTTNYLRVNIYGGTNPYDTTHWNNWNVGTAGALNVTSPALKFADGTPSTITAKLSRTNGIGDNSVPYGSGMAPEEVIRYFSYGTALRTLTINGLAANKIYSIELYASRRSTAGYSTIFTIGSVSDTIKTDNNFLNKAVFKNLRSDTSGRIVVNIVNLGSYNYINGFSLHVDSTITTAPANKYVKVNVYGGTNPYSDVSWNNWNVGTVGATNVLSGAFKYSDGTTSTINAVLSDTRAINDNGTTYGSGMAPAEVLRYDSYSNVARKLTIRGLSTTKKYTIELYASRNDTGNSTIFTINRLIDTINTSHNLTNKAVFTNVTPNTAGQIVVSINQLTSYSYLNGFIVTEGTVSSSTSRVAMQPNELLIDDKGSVNIYPNPVRDNFQLRLNNDYRGRVNVQVIDMSGKIHKELGFVKDQQTTVNNISLNELNIGFYIIRVQMGARTESQKISRL
jgi:dienelactone hydrolase